MEKNLDQVNQEIEQTKASIAKQKEEQLKMLELLIEVGASEEKITELRNLINKNEEQSEEGESIKTKEKKIEDKEKDNEKKDENYEKAKDIILNSKNTSPSNLAKKLNISERKAKKLLSELEKEGIVGPDNGSAPREFLGDKKDSPEQKENDEEKNLETTPEKTDEKESVEKGNENKDEEKEVVISPEQMRTLDEARENYIKEYKKCKSEADRQGLINKTKNSILNIFKSKENKKSIKLEDFFTKKMDEAKREYDAARIALGNEMFFNKKAELEKAGLSGEELEIALTEYKATEILAKTIIEEKQKLIDMKAAGAPIKPAAWKRILNGYLQMPRWKRVALSTLVFLPVAATGALGASAIALGGVGAGIAGLAGVKFGMSMAIGTGVAHFSKGIDWARKGSDLKFTEKEYSKKTNLKNNFAKGEIGLEEYEKGILEIENDEKKHARNRVLLKAGVGIAIAGIAGYEAYHIIGGEVANLAGGHNTAEAAASHAGVLTPGQNHVDSISGTPKAPIENIPAPKVEHVNIEATADHGQGAISTIRELQHNLKIQYGNDLDHAPANIKHILETNPQKLAMEYGMYKPGQADESAFNLKSIKVDGEGNMSYQLKGGSADIKVDNMFKGKMFDSDHSGLKNTSQTQVVNENIVPKQVDPVTGEEIKIPGTTPDTIPSQVNPIKVEVIRTETVPVDTVPQQTAPITPHIEPTTSTPVSHIDQPQTTITPEVKPVDFKFGNPNNVVPLTAENGTTIEMKFIYDSNHHIVGTDVESSNYHVNTEAYTDNVKLHELDGFKQMDASKDIYEMAKEAQFLDKLPHNTTEYQYLHNHVVEMQQNIIKNYGNIINPDKLQTGGSVSNISTAPVTHTETILGTHTLSQEQLIKVGEVGRENIEHLFPEKIELWDDIVKHASAHRVLTELGEDGVRPEYQPLISYMQKLQEVSGLKPTAQDLINSAETIPHYINRALEKIEEMGQLNKVKL